MSFASTCRKNIVRLALLLVVTAQLAACGGGGSGGSTSASSGGSGGSGAGAISTSLVAERVLAQTGLAIALASTVLQSQVQILFAEIAPHAGCNALTGGGSLMSGTGTVTVYYDTTCSHPYIVATPVVTTSTVTGATRYDVTETATYYGLASGAAIGAMSLAETALLSSVTGTVQVNGTGVFTPAGSATTPVHLGLYCSVPGTTTGLTSLNLSCAGGVAQDFPTLALAVGAVTPMALTVNLDATTGATTNVTFTGGGTPVTGPLGSLALTNPTANSLVVAGGAPYSPILATGGAAAFALFPPTPTSWNVADATADEQFHIAVIDDTTRSLAVSIARTSTGGSLATGTLDQSGTGTIVYSDGSRAKVTSWTLAN